MLNLLVLGAVLNPFSLPNMNNAGTPYNSAEHKNAVFVIEAFFNGCHYCHVNAPNVHDLVTAYRGNDRVQVLDVGIDSQPIQYDSWIRQTNPSHPVLNDSRRSVIGALKTQGFPSTYVLNCKGEVIGQTEGVWGTNAQRQIKQSIEQGLGTKCEEDPPPPPGSRVFTVESPNVVLKVTLRPTNKLTVNEAQVILAPFMK